MKKICHIIFLLAIIVGITACKSPNQILPTGEKIIEADINKTCDILADKLNDIGELATEQYSYTETTTYESTMTFKDWHIPLTNSHYTIVYKGVIKAGINFSDIIITNGVDSIYITLPDSKVLSHELNNDSFKLLDEKSSIFNPISVENVNDSINELKAEAEKKALEGELLSRAFDNASKMLDTILNTVVPDGIQVVFN